jgi:hypothetical protein
VLTFPLAPLRATDREGVSVGVFSIISMIVVGFIVGALARWFYPGAINMGFWATAVVGVVGSLVGGCDRRPDVEIARRQVPSGRLDPVDRRRTDRTLAVSDVRREVIR